MDKNKFQDYAYTYTQELWKEEIEMYKRRAEKVYKTSLHKIDTPQAKKIKDSNEIHPMIFIDFLSQAIMDNTSKKNAKHVGRLAGDLSDLSKKFSDYYDLISKMMDLNYSKKEQIADILIDLDTLMAEINFHSKDYMSNVQAIADILYEQSENEEIRK